MIDQAVALIRDQAEPSVGLTRCAACGLPTKRRYPQTTGALFCALCDVITLSRVDFPHIRRVPKLSAHTLAKRERRNAYAAARYQARRNS